MKKRQSMNTAAVMKRMKTVATIESQGLLTQIKSLRLEEVIRPNVFQFFSSILNVPGESTLRRDFQRLQQENKERSEAHKRQQAQLAAQRRDTEEHKSKLLHDRQKRIEEQKEQRRRLEEVKSNTFFMLFKLNPNSVIR